MSEQPTPPASGEMIANARADWIARGLSAEQFDAAISAPEPSPEVIAPIEITDAPDALTLDAGQIAEMRQAWIAAGHDAAAFDAAAVADGIAQQEDATTPEQAEHDREWAMTPRAPSAYRIDYQNNEARNLPIERLAEADAQAREFLAALQFDPALGAAFFERAMDVGQMLSRMSDGGRELWEREQRAEAIRQLGGEEEYSGAMEDAARVFNLAKGLPAHEALRDKHVLADAFLLRTLANHSRGLTAWAEARP